MWAKTAFSAAIAAAVPYKGIVYFPSCSTPNGYAGKVVVQDISGLTLLGDGSGTNQFADTAGSTITSLANDNTIDIFSNVGSGSVNNIIVRGLKAQSSGSGTALRFWNCILCTSYNNMAFALGTGAAFSNQGSGQVVVINNYANAHSGPALYLGNAAGVLTNSGPFVVDDSQFVSVGAAIQIEGDPLGVQFNNIQYSSQGGMQAGSVTIDGPVSGNPVGSVTFISPHGESNYNTTNTAADFLIGATHKFGNVQILGGNAWGLGNNVNFQRDWLRVVAARSVSVNGTMVSKLSGTSGYTRSMIRLESTFPAAGDFFSGENLIPDNIDGTVYSDANSKCSGIKNCIIGGQIIDLLNLGTALTPNYGGTGISSYTIGDLIVANGASSLIALSDVAVNNVLLSGGVGVAPLYGKVALTAMATQAANTVLANATSGTATPTAFAMPSCSAATSALNYTTNSGIGCNSSITATTNANLTGPITSVGNATSIASQTGTGTKFVVDTSPTLVTPTIGVATYTSLQNTANSVATITAEKGGGDVFATRFNSSNPRFVIGIGGGSGSVMFGNNLVFGSSNTWNFDTTGKAWWIGNVNGAAASFLLCANTGTAGADAGTSGVTTCGFSMTTTGMALLGGAQAGNVPTGTVNEFATLKASASGTAPGAGYCKVATVAGTNAGTCKLQAICGTTTTPTTIIDNVGGSC